MIAGHTLVENFIRFAWKLLLLGGSSWTHMSRLQLWRERALPCWQDGVVSVAKCLQASSVGSLVHQACLVWAKILISLMWLKEM